MIEDIIAQSHVLIDSMTFEVGSIALSTLRSINESQSQAGPFSKILGIQFEEMADGRCKAALEVKQHLLNPLGIAHGGVAFSLADSTSGGAALSALGEPRIVTQDMQIRYHAPVRPGWLVAEAEILHKGQRTISTLCKVSQEGVLAASVTATFAILSEEELSMVRNESG